MDARSSSSSLLQSVLREPRTRIAIATAAASAPVIWGGLAWVSALSFVGQLIVGIVMGIATMASFHFLGVHRAQRRMHKAVTVTQLSLADGNALKRILPISSLPSWIQNVTDFERVTWINRELEEVWPFLDQAASEMLRLQIQPVLDEYKFGPVSKIKLRSVTLGTVAPMLGGIKFTGIGKNEAMLEIEVDWRHGRDQKIVLEVETTGPDFKVQVVDIVFHGILRILLKPLIDQIPCFGAAVVSFREPPTIDFGTKFLGGDVLQLPGVDSIIDEIIKTAVTDMLVWPSRMVIPILPGDYSFLELKPVAYVEVKIIEAKHLPSKEVLGKSDPFTYVYVRQKQELMQRTATRSNTANPTWNEDFVLDVEDPETQHLNFRVMDSDQMKAADFLGFGQVPIKELEPNVPKDIWLKLVKDPSKPEPDKNRGDLHVVVTFKPYQHPDKSDGPKELLPPVPEGAGVAAKSTDEQKKDEGTIKKDISTPVAAGTGTTPDASTGEVGTASDQENGSKVTAGGLVQNSAAKGSAGNNSENGNVPSQQEENDPPALSTPKEENPKSSEAVEEVPKSELDAMNKFIEEQ